MVLAPAPIALALLALCTSTIPSYIFSSSYVAFCWDNARAQRSHIALCCRPVSASLHGSCCLCRASDKLLPPPSRAAGASWLRSAYRSLSSHISHRSRPGAPSTTLLPPSLLLLPPNRSSAPTSLPPSLRNGRRRPCGGDRHHGDGGLCPCGGGRRGGPGGGCFWRPGGDGGGRLGGGGRGQIPAPGRWYRATGRPGGLVPAARRSSGSC